MGRKLTLLAVSLFAVLGLSLGINAQNKGGVKELSKEQKKENEAKAVAFVNKLGIYYGASIGSNFSGNIAPFSRQYRSSFEKAMMNYYIGLTYSSIGLEYSYDIMSSTAIKKGEQEALSNISYHFIGLSSSSKHEFGHNKRWVDNHQLSIGYVRYNNNIDMWGSADQFEVSSNGFGMNYRYTIGYNTLFNIRPNSLLDAVSISLTLGTKLYTTFAWNGDERFISNATYQGKLFGANANFALIPYIGLNIGLK